MKHILSIFLILSIGCIPCLGQVAGTILSENTEESVIGCTVRLSVGDSVLSYTTSDVEGDFYIDVPMPWQDSLLTLTLSAVGYNEERVRFTMPEPTWHIGTIHLTDSIVALDEMTVTADRIATHIDKYIIAPKEVQIRQATSSLRLLQLLRLPNLKVDPINNSMTIDGKEVVYKVNGVPKTIDQIRALDPENIARIEYTDHQTIQYADRDAGGVINFILKERPLGYSIYNKLNVGATANTQDNILALSLNYKKSEFSLNYAISHRQYANVWTSKQEEYRGSSDTIQRQTHYQDPFGYLVHNIQANYTYVKDSSFMFSVTATGYIGDNQTTGRYQQTEIMRSDTTRYDVIHDTKIAFQYPSLDVFFKHTFRDQSELEYNIVGTYGHEYSMNNNAYAYATDTARYINDATEHRWSVIGEVAYNKPFRDSQLRVGLQNQYSQSHDTYLVGVQTTIDRLRSNNTYAYINYSGEWEILGYAIGTGVKMLSVSDDLQQRFYVRNLTTARLMIRPAKGLTINAFCSYTPIMPNLSAMHDLTLVRDNLNLHRGNPNLKPSEYLYPGMSLRYSTHGFTASVQYSYLHEFNALITDKTYENGYYISSVQNADYWSRHSARCRLSYEKDFENWGFSLDASFGYSYYTSDFATRYHHTLGDFHYDVQADIYYKDLSFTALYISREKALQGEQITQPGEGPYWMMDLNYTWKYLTFGARTLNLFCKRGLVYTEEWIAGPYSSSWERDIQNNRNYAELYLVFSFHSGKRFESHSRSLQNADSGSSSMKL